MASLHPFWLKNNDVKWVVTMGGLADEPRFKYSQTNPRRTELYTIHREDLPRRGEKRWQTLEATMAIIEQRRISPSWKGTIYQLPFRDGRSAEQIELLYPEIREYLKYMLEEGKTVVHFHRLRHWCVLGNTT